MPYTFTLTATIPATPQEVYEAWLDSLGHSEMTGGEASMSDLIDAEVSAWDGYITGRNLELIAAERIVQSWRTSQFGDEHEDSVITVLLEPAGSGTLLTLEHSNVPDDQKSYEEGGWESNYFEPMIAYFSELRGEAAPPAPRQPRKRSAAKTSPGKAAKSPAKSTPGSKRAGSTKKPNAAAPKAAPAKIKAKSKPKSEPKSKPKSKAKSKPGSQPRSKGKAGAAAARSRAKARTRKRVSGKRK